MEFHCHSQNIAKELMFLEAGKKRVRIKWKGLENSVDVNKENDSLFSVESLENSGEIKKETERWTFSAKKERMLQGKKWTE